MDCAESGTCAGQIKDYNTFNPYRPESTSRTGYNFVFEPLYFYNAFEGKLIPWIATDHRFNDTYTEVEIAIRPGVTWSDGHAVDGARLGFYGQHAAAERAFVGLFNRPEKLGPRGRGRR